MVDANDEDKALFPERAGDRLRAARVSAGMDLSDVASRTRIPLRHLQAIEAGDYSSFPSSTYCVGFVKAYARAVGEDEAAMSRQVRVELGQDAHGYRTELHDYDDADPARIPSRTLAWTAAAIALLLAIGYGVWRTQFMNRPDIQPAPTVVQQAPKPAAASIAAAQTSPAASGEVVLTAIEPVWVRIYDATDKVLFEKEMAKGERYVVPADANNPQIRTGRAELIAVTINGSAVPALGPPERTVKDVGISAAALAARPPAASLPVPEPTPKPSATRTRPRVTQPHSTPVTPHATSIPPAATPAPATPQGQPPTKA